MASAWTENRKRFSFPFFPGQEPRWFCQGWRLAGALLTKIIGWLTFLFSPLCWWRCRGAAVKSQKVALSFSRLQVARISFFFFLLVMSVDLPQRRQTPALLLSAGKGNVFFSPRRRQARCVSCVSSSSLPFFVGRRNSIQPFS